jgi:hypothetical protein
VVLAEADVATAVLGEADVTAVLGEADVATAVGGTPPLIGWAKYGTGVRHFCGVVHRRAGRR